MNFLKRHLTIYFTFSVLIALYLLNAVNISATDADIAKYHLSQTQAFYLVLGLALPYVIVWLIGLAGYIRLNEYYWAIKNSSDGKAVSWLSWGILWLLLWLPITSVLSGYLDKYSRYHIGFTTPSMMIKLYVGVAVLFLAYAMLYFGSRRLASTLRRPSKNRHRKIWGWLAVAVYMLGAAIYIYVLFKPGGITGGNPVNYMPDWLYLITAVVPRLVMWLMGLAAVWNLYFYAKWVTGRIYKRSFRIVAFGLGLIIASLVAVVLMTALSDAPSFDLRAILEVVYGLLLVVAAGYVLVAIGATHLRQIEKA